MKNLSIKAKSYILTVIGFGSFLFIKYSEPFVSGSSEITLYIYLLGIIGAITLLYKVVGATDGSHFNITFLVYGFSYVLLGLPETLLVILISNIIEWIKHKYPWYIQTFNISQYAIAFWLADVISQAAYQNMVVFSSINLNGLGLAALIFVLTNHLLVGLVLVFARGQSFSESGVFKFFTLFLDFSLFVMGISAALLWISLSPMSTIFVLIPLYMIYSTLRVPALERKSEIDSKTGLYNSKYFSKAVKSELARANRFDRPLSIVMGDMDLLRNINNTYGHLAGDEALVSVAKAMKKVMREYDIISRFGGEEFAILLPETATSDAYKAVEKLRSLIEGLEISVPTSQLPIKVTMSFGIAGRENQDQTISDLIHNADTALYGVKISGRNGIKIYGEENYTNLFSPVDHPSNNAELLETRIENSGEDDKPELIGEELNQEKNKNHKNEKSVEPGESQVNHSSDSHKTWAATTFIAFLTIVSSVWYHELHSVAWTPDWLGLTLFGSVVLFTEWFSIDIYFKSTSVSTSAAPIIGGILLFGPVGALVVSLTFALVAFIKHRSRLSRFFFNASNQLLAGLFILLPLNTLDIFYDSQSLFFQFSYTLFSAGVLFLVTTILISVGIKLDRGLPFWEFWKKQFSWLIPYYLIMGIISFVFTYSYQIAGVIGVLAFVVPLFMLRLGQKQYIDRTKEMVVELSDKNQVLEKQNEEIKYLNKDLLLAFAEIVDQREPFVLGHSEQVAHYAVLLGNKLGLNEKRIELLHKAGLFHDIGKLKIPPDILSKSSSLTEKEYEIVKKHPQHGVDIIEKWKTLQNIIPVVLHHHEWFDGSGYPMGLPGHEIPLEARIVGLADAVEAMATDRPYRKGLTLSEIKEELQIQSGRQFDPTLVQAFLQVINDNELEPIVINLSDKLNSRMEQAII